MTGFDPPLQVKGNPVIIIRSLDDAAQFLHEHPHETHVNHNREGILRRLQAAHTPAEQDNAAKAFIGWLEAEVLRLPSPGPSNAP